MKPELFRLVTSDGARLCAGFWPGPQGTGRGFLMIPGFWGDWRREAYRKLAEALADRTSVLAANMRGHSGSSGWFAFGQKEHEDAAALYGEARRRGLGDLTAVGFSLGGWALASHLARCPQDREATRHLVLVSTPARLPLMPRPWKHGLLVQLLRGGRGWVRPNPLHLWPPRSLCESMEALGDLPVTLVYGNDDWMVPPHHGEALHAAGTGPRRWVFIPDPRGLHAEMLALFYPGEILRAFLSPTAP